MNNYLTKNYFQVVGYTKKVEKYWLYSQKTVDLLREYLERFPELQNLVNTESANDTFRLEEMFPDKQTRYAFQNVLVYQNFVCIFLNK